MQPSFNFGSIKSVAISAAFLGAALSLPAQAAVVSADWLAAGDGLLTRDVVNGLEWLDLTQTRGVSFNEALADTAVGSRFAGFRIPTLDDLFGLYGEAVGPVTSASNGNTPIFDFTSEERAAQAKFVEMIGVTFTFDFPGAGERRDAIGLLRPGSIGADPAIPVAGGLFFYFGSGVTSYSWFNNGYAGSTDYADGSTGVYLVRSIGPGAVPEATTWAMMIAGFGLVGATMRRQRRITSVPSHAVKRDR